MLITSCKVPDSKKSSTYNKTLEFSFAVHNSVKLLNTEHWNSVVKFGSEFLQIPYLTVLEKEHPNNMRFYYAIIYKAKKPVAIAYFQVVDFSIGSFESLIADDKSEFACCIAEYLKKHFKNHLKRNAEKINMRLLICGNAFISGMHGFVYNPEITTSKAFDLLIDVIDNIDTAEKVTGKVAAVLVKDFYPDEQNSSKELKSFKYHDFLVEPNMVVHIKWKTFDEYLNAMSKKYRNRAKTVIKKGTEIQRKAFSSEEITANSTQINTLYQNVHLKAKFRLASLSSTYFSEIKKAMGDRFVFVGYYNNKKLVGFRTSFLLKKSIEAHFIGIDYSMNKELDLYQNILYDYVEESIENKTEQLFLGRTASEIKTTVGAEAQQLICYVRHRNPLSNKIIKPFIDYLKPDEWIPRNPFKEIGV